MKKERKPKRYTWLKDPDDKTIKELEPADDVPVCEPDKMGRGPRQCICGARIKLNWTLCPTCLKHYGNDRNAWPDWLKAWVKDNQAEVRNEQDHRDLEFIDGVQYANAGGGNKIAPKANKYETSRDDLNSYRSGPPGALNENQLYSQMSASDRATVNPGDYPNAAAGRSKYDNQELDQYSPQAQSAKIWAIDDRVKGSETPIDEFTAIDNEIMLNEAIADLPPRQRQVTRLFIEGYTQDEIAEMLGISQQMVSKIKNAVVKTLRKRSN